MNVIKVNVDFTNRKITKTGVDLTSGDYNSTKMIFEFDRNDGIKIFEMKDPDGNVIFVSTIKNNEVILTAKDENDNYSTLFTKSGDYIYEISLYKDSSKLASASDYLIVNQEQIVISDSLVEPYMPVFDEMINELQDSLVEVDNLNIDASKQDNITTIELTDKNGNTKTVEILDGENGKDGVDGQDYVITESDYREIADIVVNENNFVSDANYVHTDNNYTTEEKTKLSELENYNDTNLRNLVNSKQDTLTAGENITIENNVISSTGGGVSDYEEILNKPQINEVELIGNKTFSDLGKPILDNIKYFKISDYSDGNTINWGDIYDAVENNSPAIMNFDLTKTISVSSNSDYLPSNVSVTKGILASFYTTYTTFLGSIKSINLLFQIDQISYKIYASQLGTNDWTVRIHKDEDRVVNTYLQRGTFILAGNPKGIYFIGTNTVELKFNSSDTNSYTAYPFGGYILVTNDIPLHPTSTSAIYAVWLEYNNSSGFISKKYAKYSSSGIVTYNAQLINLADFAQKNQPNNFTSNASFSRYFPTGPSNSVPTYDNELVNKKYVDDNIPDTTNMELTTNKVTSLTSESTDEQYPSAKAVYDALENVGSVNVYRIGYSDSNEVFMQYFNNWLEDYKNNRNSIIVMLYKDKWCSLGVSITEEEGNGYIDLNSDFLIGNSGNTYGGDYYEVEIKYKRATLTDGVITNVGNWMTKRTHYVLNANANQVLYVNNTKAFTPTSNYNPVHKKYVDDLVGDIESLLEAI